MESKVIAGLRRIRERYFRPVIANQKGLLVHHGDCDIHRAKEMSFHLAHVGYCTICDGWNGLWWRRYIPSLQMN